MAAVKNPSYVSFTHDRIPQGIAHKSKKLQGLVDNRYMKFSVKRSYSTLRIMGSPVKNFRPFSCCESQRRGAVTVVPMAGEDATCADVWKFSRPAPDPPGPMTADTTSKRQLTAD